MRRVFENGVMSEFQQEALRLVKELAEDEVKLQRASELAIAYEHKSNKLEAEGSAEYLRESIHRKITIMETIINY